MSSRRGPLGPVLPSSDPALRSPVGSAGHCEYGTPDRPPFSERGLPLAVRLGLVTSLVVVLVVGTLTHQQQRREISSDHRALEALLSESLAPLARQVERAATLDDVRAWVVAFQHGYLDRGYPDTRLVLRNEHGEVLASAPVAPATPTPNPATLSASVRVRAPALGPGTALLTLTRDGSSFAAAIAGRWREWRLNLLVTALCLIVSLQVAIYFLLTRPLGRLVRQFSKLEAGYLCDIEPGYGASEIRWLGWQCRRLCLELSENARRLVRAERRAMGAAGERGLAARSLATDASASTPLDGHDLQNRLLRRYLVDRLRVLQLLPASDPVALEMAEEVWTGDVVDAERLGEMDLKAQLENAALKLLHPHEYAEVERELAALVAANAARPRKVAGAIARALGDQGVHFIEIQHRVKHVAGVWRKMRDRALALSEVQDVFAFRIIVADEQSCYAALRAVHQRFEPEPFRFKDYIAEPKANGYQSLHTAVRDPGLLVFEIQIRSLTMHQAAERGASAHWRHLAGKLSMLGASGLGSFRRWLTPARQFPDVASLADTIEAVPPGAFPAAGSGSESKQIPVVEPYQEGQLDGQEPRAPEQSEA